MKAKKPLTADRLHELLNYDPHTGEFTRRITTSRNAKAGDVAGGKNTDGYVVISVDGRAYYAHRLAWLYMRDEWPPALIDHENTDCGDNRWKNLRPATRRQNAQNLRGAHADNKVGILGVMPHRGRWTAQIASGGKRIYLGMFDTPELAHAAYLDAKAKLHPHQTLTAAP